MFEGIKNIVELFLDKSKHWTLRASVFISIIGILFILDLSLNLSSNVFINNKIESLTKIQTLKRNYNNDSINLKKITDLENKIIDKKHYSDFLFPNFSLNFLIKSNIENIKDQSPTKIVKPNIATNNSNIRSYFWMLISSNYLFVIVFVVMIFFPLYGKEQRTLKSISGWFAGLISFSLIIILVTWVSFKIPLIYNEPIFNYILNFIIHTIFIILIAKNNNK